YSVSGLCLRDLTPFRDVRQLPPGHSLIVENGKFRIEPYWDFPSHPEMSRSDYVDCFLELFKRGLKCSIDENTNIWAELSGGLDSSAIVAIAQQLLHQKDRCFSTITFGFDEATLSDERPWAQLVIDHCKPRAHFISGDTYYPFRDFDAGAVYWDMPHAQI